MTTNVTDWCFCDGGRPVSRDDHRLSYHQCPCCGALLTAEDGEFPAHLHVTRFADLVALPT